MIYIYSICLALTHKDKYGKMHQYSRIPDVELIVREENIREFLLNYVKKD